MEIAFRVGSTHLDLSFVIQVPLWNSDRSDGFEDQIIFFFDFIGDKSIGNPSWDNNVILGPVREFAENGFDYSPTLVDKNNFVSPAISIVLELVVGLCRPHSISSHILIEQHRDPAGIRVASARNIRGLEMMMTQWAISNLLWSPMLDQLDVADAGRRPEMIHD